MEKKAREKQLINKLILLGGVFGYSQIADIILVFSGFKPAAMVELSRFRDSKLSLKSFSKKVEDLEKIMTLLSLEYKLHINYPKDKKEITSYSYVARDQRTLKKLVSAHNETSQKKRRLVVGKLLGYPKIAVGGFATGKVIEVGELPPEVLRLEELKFLRFRLSKNWKNELRYVRLMRDEIKNIAPALYQKIKE